MPALRRKLFEAGDIEPERPEQGLEMIAALYAIEAKIREQQLSGVAIRAMRMAEAKPLVDRFFRWLDKQFESQGFLPNSPLTAALAYARERREGIEVYLNDPDGAIDTNHFERSVRAILMGRRNCMFAGLSLVPSRSDIVQSLLVTCRLHNINPYDYVVDVLQRVGQHPASSRVHELTPRIWKQRFVPNPLRSDLHHHAS